jgi:hypothetical protein
MAPVGERTGSVGELGLLVLVAEYFSELTTAFAGELILFFFAPLSQTERVFAQRELQVGWFAVGQDDLGADRTGTQIEHGCVRGRKFGAP